MEAGKDGLTRGRCFVASRLKVVAVAGLLLVSLCVLGVAGFHNFFVFFSSNAHGLLQGGYSWLAWSLTLGIWMMDTSQALKKNKSVMLTGEVEDGQPGIGKPKCTVEDLLPRSSPDKSFEWTEENVVEPRYDCTCAAAKARYFCPSADNSGYPMWVPQAVLEEKCESITRSELVGAPLPPDFKVLMYGNSHLRQVNEAIMCMFQAALTSKRVTLVSPTSTEVVAGDFQCRACYDRDFPDGNADKERKQEYMGYGCLTETDTCRCTDDWGEFYFDNGATVHYTFEHHQEKNIDDARYDHGNETLSFYDAVIVNPGNGPRMTQTHVVELAHELQAIGVPLFWLSSYDGHGDIGLWSEEHRERFTASGAHFVPIGDMARGLKAWTKGSVEGSHSDRHYCLPGPPDEMALLMLKLLWAVYEEKK